MRPRGIGRGPIRAAMRQARYQRYYNRGSQANWESMKAMDAAAGSSLAKFFGYSGFLIAGILIAFIAGAVSPFHGLVMVVLTAPIWLLAGICLKLSD